METTERIVEAYVRYVKGWATNRTSSAMVQKRRSILLLNDPVNGDRNHIEKRPSSISHSYRAPNTAKAFTPRRPQDRNKQLVARER